MEPDRTVLRGTKKLRNLRAGFGRREGRVKHPS